MQLRRAHGVPVLSSVFLTLTAKKALIADEENVFMLALGHVLSHPARAVASVGTEALTYLLKSSQSNQRPTASPRPLTSTSTQTQAVHRVGALPQRHHDH